MLSVNGKISHYANPASESDGRYPEYLKIKESRFIFIPSLPWVAMGSKTIDSISFALEGPLKSKGIGFIEAKVDRVDPKTKQVHMATEVVDYDYLVVATG